ncbi:unnamed protein product [Cylicocyclus nassatus]|uniref:PB1 domain-containing protein n=1 Tax=Cylicocyclus nassatus TaxID=53992 RepID=A0AA36GKQ1_CYLNA|nr:unnamed protein product [Cylicocyclus nassatus]
MSEERTILIKVYFEIPRFTIIYKNKEDLFNAFQKKLKEFNLDIDDVTWADWEGDRSLVNTPNDVLAAAEAYTESCVKLFHRTSHYHKTAVCSSSDEQKKKQAKTKKLCAETEGNEVEERTAAFKIFFEVPRFTLTFRNKKDLFEAFQKKLKKLNLDVDDVSWADWNGDRSLIETPDDLFGAVELYSGVGLKIFYPTIPPDLKAVCSSSDEEETKREVKAQNKCKARKASHLR